MFLLDTNVLSELRRPELGGLRAGDNVLGVGESILEIELGVLRVERRDPAQGVNLRLSCTA